MNTYDFKVGMIFPENFKIKKVDISMSVLSWLAKTYADIILKIYWKKVSWKNPTLITNIGIYVYVVWFDTCRFVLKIYDDKNLSYFSLSRRGLFDQGIRH